MQSSQYIKWIPKLEDPYERTYIYRRLCLPLLNKGMVCFEMSGYMENVWGEEVIKAALEYCLEREWYGRCAYLMDLRKQFLTKFGEVKKQD